MKKFIFLLLAIAFPAFVFAQKSFLDNASLIITTGYSSPEGQLSHYSSGSIAVNAAIAYNLNNNTQAVLNFSRTSFGHQERLLGLNIPTIYSFSAGINHNFGNEVIIPYLEGGGGFSMLKKLNDLGHPEHNYSTLPMVYGRTGGSLRLGQQVSFSAGLKYNRIFRNPDYEFLTLEGGLQFRLK